MKRFAWVMIGAVALTGCVEDPNAPTTPEPSPSFSAAVSGDAYVPGRVLVRFEPGAAGRAIVAAEGAEISGDVTLGIKMLSVPDGRELVVARALERNPNVEFAEPDYIRTFADLVAPADPFFGYKWDLSNDGTITGSNGSDLAETGVADADMDWLEAQNQLGAFTGSAVIGIIDTGILHDHEDLAGKVLADFDFFAGDSDATDDDGHGTHVAGIAAAYANNGTGVAGVAYGENVKLVVAKVCGPSGRGGPFGGYGCPISAIAEGITWAVDNGANTLNLSLGGGSGSESVRTALQYAGSNDVLPFCAAGNGAGPVSFPAAWPECVAVSATDWSDNLASYSNSGPEVVLAAPGGDDENANGYSFILSTYGTGPTDYAFIAGTSMASPQAAGLAALLHALGVTDDQAKLDRMTSTADDLGPAGRDESFGFGRINVATAVSGLTDGGDGGDGGTTNSPPTASFTFSCTDLACDFDGSGSSDGDGSVANFAWDFGDGASGSGVTVSHSYAVEGTFTVTLTVTDDDGATDASARAVTVASPPDDGGGISLAATGSKVRGRHTNDLSWSGATSTDVDIYRNGSLLATTANDGEFTDSTNNRGRGSYTYQVCEAGTSTCSNQATVTF